MRQTNPFVEITSIEKNKGARIGAPLFLIVYNQLLISLHPKIPWFARHQSHRSYR